MKTNHYNPFNSRNFIPIDSDLRNLNLSIPPDTENVQNQSTGSGSWAAALNFILKICGSHSRLIGGTSAIVYVAIEKCMIWGSIE